MAAFRVLTAGLGDALAQAADWVALWARIPAAFSVAYLSLLFADGKVPSRGWRPVLWLFVTIMTLTFLTAALAPGPIDPELIPGLMNPLGIETLGTFLSTLAAIVFPLFPVAVVVAVISLFARYQGSGSIVRTQIKWLALAGVVAIPYFARPPEIQPGLNSLLNIAFRLVGAAILFRSSNTGCMRSIGRSVAL